MLKKFSISICLFLSLLITNYASCPFEIDSQNCDVITQSNGIIEITGIPANEVISSEVNVFNKNSPKMSFTTNQVNSLLEYSLQSPILHSGEYSLFAQGFNENKDQVFSGSKSIIIDLYQPQPPVIKPSLTSNIVTGRGEQQGDLIIAYDLNSNQIASTVVQEDLSFTMDLKLSSPAFVYFTAKSSNHLESEHVARYIYPEFLPPYQYQEVTSVQFDETSMNKINEVKSGITNKRNFYVSGTAIAPEGTVFFINGQHVQVIDGIFGTFIELNTGRNTIEAKSKSGVTRDMYTIMYDDSKFFFEEFNVKKVFETSFEILGKTSTNQEFLVYVNGEFVKEVTSQTDNTFTFAGTSPQRSKVFVEFYGKDNAYESFILYKDLESPRVQALHDTKFSKPTSLLFSLSDDVGIDFTSLKLNLNTGEILEPSMRFGEYISFDISSLEKGSYSYTLEGNDLFVREILGDTTGSFSIESFADVSIIPNSEIKVFGNKIFSKYEEISFNLYSSQAVAFKHIFVDGIDHTSYFVKTKNSTQIRNMKLKNDQGDIEFIYVDADGQEFAKEYTYFLDTQRVKLNLDSVTHISRGDSSLPESYVKVTGSINHSLFNWDSFYVNEQIPPFFTSNNYFEAYVNVEENDISFSGLTITGKGIDNSNIKNIFSLDTTNPSITSEIEDDYLVGFVGGTYQGYEETISLENMDFKRSYLGNQFRMPLEQRPGLQQIDIKGRNQLSLESYQQASIDNNDFVKPQAIILDTGEDYEIHLSGTHSKIISYNIKDSQGNSVSATSCDPFFYDGNCLQVPLGKTYTIEIQDEYKNNNTITPQIVENLETLVNFEKIYFHGVDAHILGKESLLQGSVIAQKKIDSITLNSGELCDFDGINFVCNIEASIGENIYSVNINYDEGSSSEEENITIIREGDTSLSLDVEFISGVMEFGTKYYFFDDDVITSFTIDDFAYLSYYVNGQKISYGEGIEGENLVILDLNQYVQGREKAELDIVFRAENDDIKETSVFTLIYDKSKELLLDIFIS